MAFILFNTRKKAMHYIKYLQSKPMDDYDMFYHTERKYFIKGNFVIKKETYDEYCSSSDPETGYICCSGNYVTHRTVIGRIKSP